MKKLKILHTAHLRVPAPGICNQMIHEQNAAKELNIPWTSNFYSIYEKETIVSPFDFSCSNNYLHSKFLYYKRILKESEKYDLILLRYLSCDPLQWGFLKKSNVPILTVHHTLEVPEIKSAKSLKSSAKAACEDTLGPKTLSLCKGLVAVTEEIATYEVGRTNNYLKKIFLYPNGIVYSANIFPDHRSSNRPELLFVASYFASWHGLDLLIESIKGSYQDFTLHIVGNLTIEQLESIGSDARYAIHGNLSSNDISKLSAQCWLGLSSFAQYRTGMQQACSIKTREYLYLGLPVYAGHDDVFGPHMTFFRKGPCDINLILNFANEMRVFSKEEVSKLARPYIEKKNLLKNLFDDLHKEFG